MRSNFTDQRHQYFSTSLGAPHKLEVHLTHAQLQFYEKIKEIEKMHRNFIRCHKSYVINTQNVRSINKKPEKSRWQTARPSQPLSVD